jgi:hypothetical protein
VKPSTLQPIGFEQLTSDAADDVQTATIPNGASAILVSVETTNARASFHGADPSDTVGHVIVKDLEPVFIPVGVGADIRVVSTASADAVVNITYLQ